MSERTLREITADLVSLQDDDDWEAAHFKADRLLVEAINVLSAYATDTTDEGATEALVEAWEEVGKWYA